MAYVNEGIDQRVEVLQSTGEDSLVYWPKANGAAIAPDTVAPMAPETNFVTVFDPSGVEKVARTAVEIGDDDQLILTQAWPIATYPLYEDYSALWEFVSDDVSYADRQYFDVVKNKLPCLIDTSDLQEIYPNIANHLGSLGETDASKMVRRAWSVLLDRIRSGGNRPSLILDRARLVNPGLQLAAHFVCSALSRESDDIWDKRQEQHFKLYKELFAGLGTLKYDRDEDALAANSETKELNRRRFGV